MEFTAVFVVYVLVLCVTILSLRVERLQQGPLAVAWYLGILVAFVLAFHWAVLRSIAEVSAHTSWPN